MAVLEIKETQGSQGIRKKIDKNSEGVALDILQRGIYAYPENSTIRELASNAYDAVREREVAKSILSGESRPEDHFEMHLEGDIYKDSKWDPNYFDLNYLSDDMNTYIYYEEGVYNDILRIVDNGVGIGQKRMTGYFSLGWSSKRAQKGALGKWGLGNKVALSLNIDSYTVISRYNGHKFRFEVYIDNIVSTTPKFGKNGPNEYIDVEVANQTDSGESKTFRFYYEETDELNGLEVIVPIKKHNKLKFFEAIESQLMYLPNIIFQHKEEDATSYNVVDIAAKVLYKDDNVIISESTVFNKPHILLGVGDGYINYGFVAFKELELEEKNGAVGLILNINDVEVTPSRESVIWSATTRKAIMNSYDKVVETATNMINDTLDKEDDLFAWIVKAAQIKQSISNGTSAANATEAFQKVASILDPSSIRNLVYTKNSINIKYESLLDDMLGKQALVREFKYASYNRKIVRTKIKTPGSLSAYKQFYRTTEASNKYRDRYISEEIVHGAFCVIKPSEEDNTITSLLKNSTFLQDYDSVVVPEDVMDRYLLEEENDGVIGNEGDTTEGEGATIKVDSNRLALLRKKEQKVLYHEGYLAAPFSYSSQEIKIIDIQKTFANTRTVYGTFADREIINATFQNMPIWLLDMKHNRYNSTLHETDFDDVKADFMRDYDIEPYNLMLISQDVHKHFKNIKGATHIKDFIVDKYTTDGKLIFNKHIKMVHTYGLIDTLIYKNIKSTAAMMYDRENEFVEKNVADLLFLSELLNVKVVNSINSFYSNCIQYQQMKNAGADQSLLSQYLDEINKRLPDALCDTVDEITDVDIIDQELIDDIIPVLDFYGQFKDIIEQFSSYSGKDAMKALQTYINKHDTPPTLTRKY